MSKLISEVNTLDKVVIAMFALFGILYLIARNYFDFIGGNIGSFISVVLFLLGQLFLALKSAYDRRTIIDNWEKHVFPAFSVVQKSLGHNLALLSGSDVLLKAHESSHFTYLSHTEGEFSSHFGVFLDRVAPMDFGNSVKTEGEMPFITRLRGLQKNVLIPIRDLIRWGLIMDRLYTDIDSERQEKRFAMALLELTVSLFLSESERAINKLLEQDCPHEMPRELKTQNVGFVKINYTYNESRNSQRFQFSSSTNVSAGAERLVKILNEILSGEYKLRFINKLPAFPFSKTAENRMKEFCDLYLTMAWYRSVLNHIGWTILEQLNEER